MTRTSSSSGGPCVDTRKSKSRVTRGDPSTTSAIPPTSTGSNPPDSSSAASDSTASRWPPLDATGLPQGLDGLEVGEIVPDASSREAGQGLGPASERGDLPLSLGGQGPGARQAAQPAQGLRGRMNLHDPSMLSGKHKCKAGEASRPLESLRERTPRPQGDEAGRSPPARDHVDRRTRER